MFVNVSEGITCWQKIAFWMEMKQFLSLPLDAWKRSGLDINFLEEK